MEALSSRTTRMIQNFMLNLKILEYLKEGHFLKLDFKDLKQSQRNRNIIVLYIELVKLFLMTKTERNEILGCLLIVFESTKTCVKKL